MNNWGQEERIRDARHDGYEKGFGDPHGLDLGPSVPLYADWEQRKQIKDAYHDAYQRGVQEAEWEAQARSPTYVSPLSSFAGNSEDIPPSLHGFYTSRFPPTPEEIRRTKFIAWVALAIIILLPLMICGLMLLFASTYSSGIPGM